MSVELQGRAGGRDLNHYSFGSAWLGSATGPRTRAVAREARAIPESAVDMCFHYYVYGDKVTRREEERGEGLGRVVSRQGPCFAPDGLCLCGRGRARRCLVSIENRQCKMCNGYYCLGGLLRVKIARSRLTLCA